MLVRTVSASLLLALTGCAPASAPNGVEPVAGDAQAIIDGTQASNYPEAVLLEMLSKGQLKAACTGALLAPTVVLTAGHCVFGFDAWRVSAPYASGQRAWGKDGVTLDWDDPSEVVDPREHDVGLVFLDTPILLPSYPTLAGAPLPRGGQVINVGRIDQGELSTTDLFAGPPTPVRDAATFGFPYDYLADEIIQSGDSGGPVFAAGTHTIMAVNSGAGRGSEVLARVDLVRKWIEQQLLGLGATDDGD